MKLNSLISGIVFLAGSPAFANTAELVPVDPATNDCSVSASSSPVAWPRSVGHLANVTQPIDIEIEMTGRCEVDLVIRDPRFELSSGSGSIDGIVSTSASPPSSGPLEIPLAGTGVVRLQWWPDASNSMAGSYFASVPLAVTERTTQEDLWTGFADVSLEVGADLEVAPKGVKNALDVQLGNLQIPQSATVLFDVSSNSAFSVLTSSSSGGVLSHAIAGAEIGVPYDVSVQSNGFSPSGNPNRIEAGSGEVGIKITTSGMEKAMAGYYSDTLTVTFRSEM